MADAAYEALKRIISSEVFVSAKQEPIADGTGGYYTDSGWLFDFRRVLFRPHILEQITQAFEKDFPTTAPIQVGGLEVAAIPLVTAIVQSRYARGDVGTQGFFIRKSRKKDGLMNMIEGNVLSGTPIVLVDDICNKGSSFLRQIEVLEALGHTISAVWCVLRFRDVAFYEALNKRNIRIHSLFTLDDFTNLGVKNLIAGPVEHTLTQAHKLVWKFSSPLPNYFWVMPKSGPCIHRETVFFGGDNGVLWAIDIHTGKPRWSYTVGPGSRGKRICSTPIAHDDTVYFGAYDGNIYALDVHTGKPRWICFDADWVGSSPVLAPEADTLFVGVEFGVWRKRGGIIALSMSTGKKRWWDATMPNLTHATPLYIQQHQQVAIGSNDGVLRLYDATTGQKLWSTKTGDPSPQELDSGFSAYDIKDAPVFDETHDQVIVGNMHGDVYAIDRATGATRWHMSARFGVWGQPVIHKNVVIVTSLDRHVYALDLLGGTLVWNRDLTARIFSAPYVHEDKLYIGTNTGRLHVLDPRTGHEYGSTTLTERITNRVACDEQTGRLFVVTYANELYCLEETVELVERIQRLGSIHMPDTR